MPILRAEAQFPIPPNAWHALNSINGVREIREEAHSYDIIIDDPAKIESIIKEARTLGLDVIEQLQ